MSAQDFVTIVIPNHNRRDDILETLKSAHEQDFGQFEVIVVDDNSADDSVEAIQRDFPDTQVIALPENVGPAVARNTGIKKARGSIIVGIDSDVTFPDKDTLSRIATKFSTEPEINFMSFRILSYHDGKDDVQRWWHHLPIKDYADRRFYSDYFCGAGYACRKEVMEKAGYFPEDLFMVGEEDDLAFRILDCGFDIAYCPSIEVLHKASEQSRLSLSLFRYKRRNQLWIVAKYYPVIRGLAYIVPRLAMTFLQTLFVGHFVLYCRAIWDGIRNLPCVLKNRRPLSRETWRRIDLIRSGKYHPTVSSLNGS